MKDSSRLEFRKMTLDDFEAFCSMDLDPEVMKYYTSRSHGTREDAMASFTRLIDYQALHPDLGGFIVTNKFTKEFIALGVLIHLELNPSSDKYELGYRLPVRHWNKGYATETCLSLLNYAYDVIGLKEVFGTTNPENLNSQKVLMKCGFKKLGPAPYYGGSILFQHLR